MSVSNVWSRAASGAALTPGGYAGPIERSAEGPAPQLEIPAQLDGLSCTLHSVEDLVSTLLTRLQPAITNPPPSNAVTGPGQAETGRNGCGLAGSIETLRMRAQIVCEQLNYAIVHLQF